jgi:hypothetical protein
MPSSHPDLTENNDRVDAAPRLVGWKDIAAYLGKADRTVKRWGSERGLPVHRVRRHRSMLIPLNWTIGWNLPMWPSQMTNH